MMNKLDAVIAAPNSHKILFENDMVRVLEVTIEQGVKETMHIHGLPSVMIMTNPAKIRYYNDNGNSFDIEPEAKTKTEWMDPEPLHAVENIDSKPYKAIRVELKQS